MEKTGEIKEGRTPEVLERKCGPPTVCEPQRENASGRFDRDFPKQAADTVAKSLERR